MIGARTPSGVNQSDVRSGLGKFPHGCLPVTAAHKSAFQATRLPLDRSRRQPLFLRRWPLSHRLLRAILPLQATHAEILHLEIVLEPVPGALTPNPRLLDAAKGGGL